MADRSDSTRRPGDAAPDPASPERREALGTLARATLAALVAAVAPRVRATAAGDIVGTPEDWARWLAAAEEAIAAGVDFWTANAGVRGGEVNGSAAFLPPGSLGGPSFAEPVEQDVLKASAPPQLAAALGLVSWQAWETMATSYTLSVPRAFRDFAAVAAIEVPPTSLKPIRLRKGMASGGVGITVEVLTEVFADVLGGPATDPVGAAALADFARWYERGFKRWFGKARLVHLVGKGPIPSFAPPYVPVGPVVAGDVEGDAVLLAPTFG
jgi:hypothetical protein